LSASVLLVSLISMSAYGAPEDWTQLSASTKPADKRLVADIQKLDWWRVCVAWGQDERKPQRSRRGEAMGWFLEWSRFIGSKDKGNVSTRQVDIGMTDCGVFASLGMPEHVNQTTTASGTRRQYVYGLRKYVYTTPVDGEPLNTVTAVQF